MQLPCAHGERVQHVAMLFLAVVMAGTFSVSLKHACRRFAELCRHLLLCETFERHFRRHRE